MEVSDSAKWKVAMKEELDALEKNGTWDLVDFKKTRKLWVESGSTS
jgi:hypothetical protein